MKWWNRLLDPLGLVNDDDCVHDALYEDARDFAVELEREREAHRRTKRQMVMCKRDLAGANRLIQAYSTLVKPADAERFALAIDEIERAMQELRDERADDVA